MTLHGYRLYQVNATLGRSPKHLSFEKAPLASDGGASIKVLAAQLKSLKGKTFVKHATYGARDQEATTLAAIPSRTPVLRVDEVKTVANSVEVLVSYGRKGEYGFAIDIEGGQDIELNRAAAGRQYRVVIHAPRAGDTAVMVAEVVGRTHVGVVLLHRLSVENAYAAADAGDDDESATWTRWLANGLFDEHRIVEVLNEGSIEGLRLRRHGSSAAGKRTTRDLTLTQTGLPAGKASQAQKMVKKWVKKHLRVKDMSAPATSIGALVELVDGDVSDIGFTDGTLQFSENGRTQSLGPSSLDKILVYPLGSEKPTTDVLRSKSADRLRPLMTELAVPIDFV